MRGANGSIPLPCSHFLKSREREQKGRYLRPPNVICRTGSGDSSIVATESTALLKVWVAPVIADRAIKQNYLLCNAIGGMMHYHFSASRCPVESHIRPMPFLWCGRWATRSATEWAAASTAPGNYRSSHSGANLALCGTTLILCSALYLYL
jgi:hypothetical protein